MHNNMAGQFINNYFFKIEQKIFALEEEPIYPKV